MNVPLARRRFLHLGVLGGGAILASGCHPGRPTPGNPGTSVDAPAEAGLARLPMGSGPAALGTPHFPSRLHAFVWRNWSLVPLERMARAVGGTPGDLRRMGEAMGLGRPPRITREQEERSYITVIRRNWHLLPYDQLLVLLGWEAERLAYTLREDDFLFVKLGNLKPRCAPLRWASPEPAWAAEEARVARVTRSGQADADGEPAEPLFGFLEPLAASPRKAGRTHRVAPPPDASGSAGLRFCYSYFALYGDPLLEPELDPYPEGYLEQLAATGVTGVWLQGVLYKLAEFPWQPRLSERYEERLRNLAALVRRAARHGIRILLYLNEPRAMPLPFFAAHPELRGVTEGDHATLCTSAPEVRAYLRSAVASIVRTVPDLGGFFTITASENLTNCWSHGAGATCSRCGPRGPAEVIAEVNATLQQGIEDGGGGPGLIAWDWGWAEAWATDAIDRLPPRVSLMCVSEWSLPIERAGVKTTVGEYSLSAVGPGPRARRHWQHARRRGLRILAKIQANNTWELSAIPYVPVLENVAEHAARLREQRLDGILLSWTLGGHPSPNLETVAAVLAGGTLDDVAHRRFGASLAPRVLEAWRGFSAAFREFPFDGGVVYSAPLQMGPANPLWPEPTGYAACMVGIPYDHLDGWRGPYPVEAFIGQLRKVADGFGAAAEGLERALRESVESEPDRREAAGQEARLGRVAEAHFRSVANQSEFVRGRDALRAVSDAAERERWVGVLRQVIEQEEELARRVHGLQRRDSRVGFEASNHYFYVPLDLIEKVIQCRWLLEDWLPRQRQPAGRP